MGRGYRPQMLGEEIRRITSDLLIHGKLRNEVFQKNMVSISGVDVSGDGSYATLYVSALSIGTKQGLSDEDKKEILDAFELCKGYIRSEIAHNVKLRYTPELLFKFDNSFDYGAKMDKIIDNLNIRHDAGEEKQQNEQ